MLDGRYARTHRKLYPLSAVSVRGHFPFQLARLIDHRLQLFVGVLSRADGIAFRQYAAGRTRLDHVCAILNLITNGSADLIWSISDALFDTRIEKPRSKTILIAVTAAHAKRMTGAHHS